MAMDMALTHCIKVYKIYRETPPKYFSVSNRVRYSHKKPKKPKGPNKSPYWVFTAVQNHSGETFPMPSMAGTDRTQLFSLVTFVTS